MIMLNGKDSFWLQLEVCREFQRSRCTRSDGECKFAHPPNNVEIQSNGRVTACYDSIKVSLLCPCKLGAFFLLGSVLCFDARFVCRSFPAPGIMSQH